MKSEENNCLKNSMIPSFPHWRVVGKAPPQPHPACRLARITPSNSSLSAGFWKKATAPGFLRIRHFGFLATRFRASRQALADNY
jgi:hypothetical protein